MKHNRGTPKTLTEALVTGLIETDEVLMTTQEATLLAVDLAPHVRDFLAQKIGALLLNAEGKEADTLVALSEMLGVREAS